MVPHTYLIMQVLLPVKSYHYFSIFSISYLHQLQAEFTDTRSVIQH